MRQATNAPKGFCLPKTAALTDTLLGSSGSARVGNRCRRSRSSSVVSGWVAPRRGGGGARIPVGGMVSGAPVESDGARRYLSTMIKFMTLWTQPWIGLQAYLPIVFWPGHFDLGKAWGGGDERAGVGMGRR